MTKPKTRTKWPVNSEALAAMKDSVHLGPTFTAIIERLHSDTQTDDEALVLALGVLMFLLAGRSDPTGDAIMAATTIVKGLVELPEAPPIH